MTLEKFKPNKSRKQTFLNMELELRKIDLRKPLYHGEAKDIEQEKDGNNGKQMEKLKKYI